MSFKIQTPPGAHLSAADPTKTSGAGDADAKKAADAAKVGKDFEAIFLRQMLSQANVAGKSGGYADMAVESLATSITSAGGVGMGRAIEQSLLAADHRTHTTAPTTDKKGRAPSSPAGAGRS